MALTSKVWEADPHKPWWLSYKITGAHFIETGRFNRETQVVHIGQGSLKGQKGCFDPKLASQGQKKLCERLLHYQCTFFILNQESINSWTILIEGRKIIWGWKGRNGVELRKGMPRMWKNDKFVKSNYERTSFPKQCTMRAIVFINSEIKVNIH